MSDRARRLLSWMERDASRLRLTFLTIAVVLLILGWVSPLAPRSDWGWITRNHEAFQKLAAVPATLLAFFDAAQARLKERRSVWTAKVDERFDEVLIELENVCLRMNVAPQMHRCGIAVWKLYGVSRKEKESGRETATASSGCYPPRTEVQPYSWYPVA